MTTRLERQARPESLLLNMGPSHPAMHGTIRIMLELDGERILNSEVEVGFLHRGFEKTCESKTYFNLLIYTDRLNYVSPLHQQPRLRHGRGEARRPRRSRSGPSASGS